MSISYNSLDSSDAGLLFNFTIQLIIEIHSKLLTQKISFSHIFANILFSRSKEILIA